MITGLDFLNVNVLQLLILIKTILTRIKGKIQVYHKNLWEFLPFGCINFYQRINNLNIECPGEAVHLLFHKVENLVIIS